MNELIRFYQYATCFCSFLGRILGQKKMFRDYLTFRDFLNFSYSWVISRNKKMYSISNKFQIRFAKICGLLRMQELVKVHFPEYIVIFKTTICSISKSSLTFVVVNKIFLLSADESVNNILRFFIQKNPLKLFKKIPYNVQN